MANQNRAPLSCSVVRCPGCASWMVVDSQGSIRTVEETQSQAWRWVDRNEVRPMYLTGRGAERLGAYEVRK